MSRSVRLDCFSWFLIVGALLTIFQAGCQKSDGTKKVYPVRGQVLYRGTPIKDCRVIFYPDDPNDIERPEAYTDDQGFFEVTARRNEPGASEGNYIVVLYWQDRNDDPDSELTFKGPNKLPEKYGKPTTSDLRVTIKAGRNDLEPFSIQ